MCIPGRPEAPSDGTMSLLPASASVTLALKIIALRVIESHSVHKAADCSRKHELHAAGFCHQLQPPASLDHPASASFTRWTNVPSLHIVQVTCLQCNPCTCILLHMNMLAQCIVHTHMHCLHTAPAATEKHVCFGQICCRRSHLVFISYMPTIVDGNK